MKKYINIKTKDIWYAEDKEHIKELNKNPNFKEIKEKNKKVVETNKEKTTEKNK